MTARELPELPVAPGEAVAPEEWEAVWLSEVERREALEPDETLGAEHELPNVRKRLLGLLFGGDAHDT